MLGHPKRPKKTLKGSRRSGRKAPERRALHWLLALGLSSMAAFLLIVSPRGARPQGASAESPAQTAAAPVSSAGAPDRKIEPSPDQKPIQVRVNEVNIPVTVLDKRGVPVIDLAAKDFEIFEDGKRQTIKYFYRGERPPLRVGLILDTSNSARPQLEFEKESAGEFVFNLLQGRSSKNRIFLQTFDSTSSILQDFTNDPDLLNEHIRKLKAGGGKALYDAIYTACRDKMLRLGPRAETRRVLVVISDGLDAQSEHTLDEAVSMAHRAETIIYTIGNAAWGYNNTGDKVLEDISQATGGAGFFPREVTPGTDMLTGYLSHGQIGETSQNKGLGASTGTFSAQRLMAIADSLEAIQRELNDQYNLGYTPTNPTMDGTYRTIKVETLRKGVELRAKPGYFATPE